MENVSDLLEKLDPHIIC